MPSNTPSEHPSYSQAEQARKQADYKVALSLYRQASENGNYYGAIRLAQMHYLGQGVTKDSSGAAGWMSKAAEIGGTGAIYEIGSHYFRGLNGVPEDFNEALKWFRKGAGLGHHRSMWRVGQMLESGKGVDRNVEQAIYWYKKAAECDKSDFTTLGLVQSDLDRLKA